jgi:hypothetical protein
MIKGVAINAWDGCVLVWGRMIKGAIYAFSISLCVCVCVVWVRIGAGAYN